MAHIQTRTLSDGTVTYAVKWREGGRHGTQHSLTVYDRLEAEHVKAYINLAGCAPPTTSGPGNVTVTRALLHHIDALSGVEERTITGYRAIARNHISPHLGGIYVSTLTRGHVTRWINTLATTPTKRTGRPASAKQSATPTHSCPRPSAPRSTTARSTATSPNESASPPARPNPAPTSPETASN